MRRDKVCRNRKGVNAGNYKALLIQASLESSAECHRSHRELRRMYGELKSPIWGPCNIRSYEMKFHISRTGSVRKVTTLDIGRGFLTPFVRFI